MRIDLALKQAAEKLARASESPRIDAEALLGRALDVPRAYLYAHPEDELDPAALDRYFRAVARRATGEPLAYITGTREFWSLDLMVGPGTLIPRPETETLVEAALRHIPPQAAARVLDLGTGCGAIAIAIARERPGSRVAAVDLSGEALAVARENARQHDASIEFLCGNWTEPVAGRCFDVVVSNPPYVAAGDPALTALRHEPGLALVGGTDGLDAIRALSRDCREVVAAGGWLLLEHGRAQGEAVTALLRDKGWEDLRTFNDLAGLPRVTEARRAAA